MSRSRTEWLIAGLFGITAVTGVALLVVYILGGQTQIEGVLLAVALGALGIGIVLWAQDLMVTPDGDGSDIPGVPCPSIERHGGHRDDDHDHNADEHLGEATASDLALDRGTQSLRGPPQSEGTPVRRRADG